MSLYGDGRREGLVAALAIVVISVGVRGLGAWLTPVADVHAALAPAALPALGGVACYRLLRAFGCSRYGAFLAGAAYALSPWLLAMAARPNEQFAAALAPLALEAAWQCRKPATQATWLRWSWLCLSAPWLAGPGLIAGCATAIAVGQLLHLVLQRDLDGERLAAAPIVLPMALTAAAIAACCALPNDGAWPPTGGEPLAPEWVVAMHGTALHGLDLTAALRVPGAALLALAALGVLRGQRRVPGWGWGGLAVLGALPTALALAARTLAMDPNLFLRSVAEDPWHVAACSWLLLIGCAALAAGSLDDVLEAPHRHLAARGWSFAIAIAVACLLPGLGPSALLREWPIVAGMVAPALLLPAWRRLGMMRLKALLAAAVIGTLAVPSLHFDALCAPSRAAPIVESRAAAALSDDDAAARWRYVAASVWLALGALAVAASMARRSRHDNHPPMAANAAITKKAPPASASYAKPPARPPTTMPTPDVAAPSSPCAVARSGAGTRRSSARSEPR